MLREKVRKTKKIVSFVSAFSVHALTHMQASDTLLSLPGLSYCS